MQFFKLKEQKIIYNYLKQDVGWLHADPLGFQKKCNVGCWLHRFLLELEENNFFPRIECHTIINRVTKKYKQKYPDDFDYHLNEGLKDLK